ncbi:MAG: AHH domain-containing protein [Rhodomicrobium sp.]
MATAILQDHHIIPQNNKYNDLLKAIEFEVQGTANRIYLPADQYLAEQLGISLHPGGPLGSYQEAINLTLEQLQKTTEGQRVLLGQGTPEEINAAKSVLLDQVNGLRDALKVGLVNGEVFTNQNPVAGITSDVECGLKRIQLCDLVRVLGCVI